MSEEKILSMTDEAKVFLFPKYGLGASVEDCYTNHKNWNDKEYRLEPQMKRYGWIWVEFQN